MSSSDKTLNSLKDVPILVTGAASFIGRHLVQHLLRLQARLYLLLKKSSFLKLPQSWQFEWLNHPLVSIHFGDILDAAELNKNIQTMRLKKVFHLAGISVTTTHSELIRECFQVNFLGTLNLLESLVKQKLDSFVFASTTDLYGKNPIPFRENQQIQPITPYGISKAAAEYLCLSYLKQYQIPVTILRISPVYGPFLKPERFIMKTFLACLGSKTIYCSSPDDSCDFLYIDDAIRGMLLAAIKPKAVQQIINLGYPQSYPIRRVIQNISSLTQTKLKAHWSKTSRYSVLRKNQISDIHQAKKILGWSPETTLEEGLEKTFLWLKSPEGKKFIKTNQMLTTKTVHVS